MVVAIKAMAHNVGDTSVAPDSMQKPQTYLGPCSISAIISSMS